MLNVVLRESNKITETIFEDFQKNTDSKEFEICDGVIVGLLEELNGKVTTLKTLLDSKSYDSLDMITRAIFENHVYLKYILTINTKDRATAYAKSAEINEFKLFDRVTEETKVGEELRGFIGKSIADIKAVNISASNTSYRDQLTGDYLKLLNTTNINTQWFNEDGKTRNFEQLCIKQDLRSEYELVYRIFSKDVHSSKALSRLKFSKNEVKVGNFNINPSLHSRISALFLMKSSRAILEYYNLKKTLKKFNTIIEINNKYK